MPGIEGGFPDQAVHAGLGAQPAEGMVAGDVHGRALDAGDLAGRGFDHLGVEAAPLPPAQVHAQEHLRPVLCLGAAGPGLDVEKGVRRVHLLREHAPQLQTDEGRLPTLDVLLDRAQHGSIVLVAGELEELGRVQKPPVDGGDHVDELGEDRAFPAQGAGAFGLVPDFRLFQVEGDLLEARLPGLEVKDTP